MTTVTIRERKVRKPRSEESHRCALRAVVLFAAVIPLWLLIRATGAEELVLFAPVLLTFGIFQIAEADRLSKLGW